MSAVNVPMEMVRIIRPDRVLGGPASSMRMSAKTGPG